MVYTLIGLALLILGVVTLIFAFGKAQYFFGETIGVFPVYERGNPNVAAQIDITHSDLPVRLILTTTVQWPMMESTAMRPFAQFDIDYGTDAPAQRIRLSFAADRVIESIHALSQTESFLLKNDQPGRWRIRLTETGYRQFKPQRAVATVKVRSSPPNLALLIFGFVASGIGSALATTTWFAQHRRR